MPSDSVHRTPIKFLFEFGDIPNSAREIIYFVIAVTAALIDISLMVWNDSFNLISASAVFVLAALLGAAGRYGIVWEMMFGVVFSIAALTPVSHDFGFIVVGIFIICVRWIIHSRYALSLLFFIVAVCAYGWRSQYSIDEKIVSSTFWLLAVLAFGFGLRWQYQRMLRIEEQALREREEARSASIAIRQDLAALLHDTIAKDLSRISLQAQYLAKHSLENREELSELYEFAAQASKRIRPMILNLDVRSEVNSVSESLCQAEKMLRTREITLDIDCTPDIDTLFSSQQAQVAILVIREGTTNMLKYAPSGSYASVSVEVNADKSIDVMMSNRIEPHPQTDITGGFGIDNLERRVQEVGGHMSYSINGRSWILFVSIPLTEEDNSDVRP